MNNKQIFVPVDLKFINLDEEDVITTSAGDELENSDLSESGLDAGTDGWDNY